MIGGGMAVAVVDPGCQHCSKLHRTVNGRIGDAVLRDEITTHAMDDRAFGLTVRRNLEESKSTKRRASFLRCLSSTAPSKTKSDMSC